MSSGLSCAHSSLATLSVCRRHLLIVPSRGEPSPEIEATIRRARPGLASLSAGDHRRTAYRDEHGFLKAAKACCPEVAAALGCATW